MICSGAAAIVPPLFFMRSEKSSAELSGDALAWLALGVVEELSPRHAHELVKRFGSPAAVLAAPGALLVEAGLAPSVAKALAGAPVRARREAAGLLAVAATPVGWSHHAHPPRPPRIP